MSTSGGRQSFTIKRKLMILSEYREGERGKGLPALAKKYGINRDTLRGWVGKKEELEKALKDNTVQSRRTRRLEGGGRKTPFLVVEDALYEWVREKNEKGLKVKDFYIKLKALNLHRDMLQEQTDPEDDSMMPIEFDASTGWVARFKRRWNLVSRRRTTSKVLPENADELVREFIHKAHAMIDKHQIQAKNVINLDQVPRYFEVENGSTIITKGSKQVVLRKGGSSHKRFTATFAVTVAGDFLQPHVLFSKLKNRPRVADGILSDVNNTGMWNEKILWRFIQANILSRRETTLSREPMLLILNAYGCHMKLVASNRLAAYNVHIAVVPERLTGVIQPLDVGLNRGFQSNYGARFDTYIQKALDGPRMQTNAGNPKVPNYSEVSQWVLDWVGTVDRQTVQKAFKSCGLLPGNFEMDNLHVPLRDLLSGEYTVESWGERYGNLIAADDGTIQPCYLPPEWYLPEITLTSLFKCMLVKLHRDTLDGPIPKYEEIDVYRSELICHMELQRELHNLTDPEYYEQLRTGDLFPGELELYAISQSERVSLNVFNDATRESFSYRCPDSLIAAIDLVKVDDYFMVSMESCDEEERLEP